MKPNRLQLLALVFFLCGAVSWLFRDPRFFMQYDGDYRIVYKRSIMPWNEIKEEEAMARLAHFDEDRKKLLASGQVDTYSLFELRSRLQDITNNVVTKEEEKEDNYEFDEAPPSFYRQIDRRESQLYEDHKRYCNTPEDEAILEKLWKEYWKTHSLNLQSAIRKEVISTFRYKLTRALFFIFPGLLLFVWDRSKKYGWYFPQLVGYRIVRFATILTGFAVSALGGGAALAQQIFAKEKKSRQCNERVEKRQSTLTLLTFGDVTGEASHDRQMILTYNHSSGFTVIQQNRQTSDSTVFGGNVTFGWKLTLGRRLDLTATAGPGFNYDNPKGDRGFNHQTIIFLIGNWNNKWFRFSNLSKLMVPTDEKAILGSRHIQTLRGPPDMTPRFLRGLALNVEYWRAGGPDAVSRLGAHWNEFEIGPLINIGEIVGRPKSIWARFTVYPYRDFCRPQPNHSRLWDVRIQYKQTFSFAR